jgi:transposase
MKRQIESDERSQSSLFPERLDDYIAENNPVRVIDVFVDELDLGELGFDGVTACRNRSASVPPGHAAEELHLRVSEPRSIEPPT